MGNTGTEQFRNLRASILEQALAERPGGWKLGDLAKRLGPEFDLGDILVGLRRRSDLFIEWDGRWLSRAASLDQDPRRVPWNVWGDDIPDVWRRFHNPVGAAAGWALFHSRLQEAASNPATVHIEMSFEAGDSPGSRIHVDHTVVLGRTTWVLWSATNEADALERLADAGMFLWHPGDPLALVDARHRLPSVNRPSPPTLAAWCLPSPLDVADTLTWLALTRLHVFNPRRIKRNVERVEVTPVELRAFSRARGAWEGLGRGIAPAHCKGCGRPLHDANSIALGYGPVCAGQRGYGAVQELNKVRDEVVFTGAVPLADVRRRILLEANRPITR